MTKAYLYKIYDTTVELKIQKFEIVKSTSHFLDIALRENKEVQEFTQRIERYHAEGPKAFYFCTKEEAWNDYVNKQEGIISDARRTIYNAEREIERLKRDIPFLTIFGE